jgi:hypothetical protein
MILMSGEVKIEGENLVFEIHGVDEILSLKRSISVPLEHVVSVSTEKFSQKGYKELKLVGARIPYKLKDGRFLTPDGLMFFEIHDPDKCVTVTLDHESYKKIVFEVEDKEATAQMIRDAIAPHKT